MKKSKIRLLLILIIFSVCGSAQVNKFSFKRELLNIDSQWHKIEIPNEMFAKFSPDFNDIRIYGFTSRGDTVEAPYLLKIDSEKKIREEIPFKMINKSYNESGYFYTFELSVKKLVNKIELEFKGDNFDRRLNLQGSQDLKEWFTIVENYRVMSIKNESADYKFTTINFPESQHQYFRVHFKNKENPHLSTSKIISEKIEKTEYVKHEIKEFERNEIEKNKTTEIKIMIAQISPVSFVNVYIEDENDYYRRFSLQYLADSVKTEKGWKYDYRTLNTGIVSSLEKSEIKINSTFLKHLKLIIRNYDNNPLNIDSISVYGYKYNLIARFDSSANYYLVYGNKNIHKPNYDIENFKHKIPINLKSLKLGDEQNIAKEQMQKSEPLFVNELWLWIVLGLIILLLGWFTIKMIKNN